MKKYLMATALVFVLGTATFTSAQAGDVYGTLAGQTSVVPSYYAPVQTKVSGYIDLRESLLKDLLIAGTARVAVLTPSQLLNYGFTTQAQAVEYAAKNLPGYTNDMRILTNFMRQNPAMFPGIGDVPAGKFCICWDYSYDAAGHMTDKHLTLSTK